MLEKKNASVVDDYDAEKDTLIVDDISSSYSNEFAEESLETISKDIFSKVEVAKLTQKSKRRATTIINKRQQSATGDAKSKYEDEEYINGYDLWDLKAPPYDLTRFALIYEENAVHNAACNAKAANTVGLGNTWKQTRKTKRSLEKAEDTATQKIIDSVHDDINRLEDIFENFHEEETFGETLYKAMIDYHALGNGFLEIGRNLVGKVAYVGHVPAQGIRVRRLRDGFVQLVYNRSRADAVFFRNFQDKETTNPLGNDDSPNELIHLKHYSPRDTYYGVPSIISALAAVVGDKLAKEYNIDYFENKAIPRYAIVIKGAKLSAAAKREVVQYFRNEVKGKSHGTLIVPLPAGAGGANSVDIKFEKLEAGVQEGSFQKYRDSNRDEIITAHRIPPSKVAVISNSNLANSRDGDKTFKEQVIGPDQDRIERRVNKIVKEFTDVIEFEFTMMDIIDDDMRSRIDDRYTRIQVKTPNEVRNDLGLPALEGGDQVLPFPTQVQKQNIEEQSKQKELDREVKIKEVAAGGTRGAPVGNSNNPKKSGPETPKDQTGTRAERGQAQDASGVRNRN